MADLPEEFSDPEACVLNPSPSSSSDGVAGPSERRLSNGPDTLLTLGMSEGGWAAYKDDDILLQQSSILEEVAERMPCVGEKEPLHALAAEYQTGSPILQEKIKMLEEEFAAIRRSRGDGNCFFRSFMFSYLEHVMKAQDKFEVSRVKTKMEDCKTTLRDLGYADFTFEDYFEAFGELLDGVIQGGDDSISEEELLKKSQDKSFSDSIVMFLRFVTTGEIRRRAEFFEPFILGFTNGIGTVDQFCKSSVEPMGEESDHVHITALTDALGVAVRVVYLDRSALDGAATKVNHHDFLPSLSTTAKPLVTLLYRPGHYDILYAR